MCVRLRAWHLAAALPALPVTAYIVAQRNRLGPYSAPLSAEQRAAVAPYFSPEVLASTRLFVAADLPIPEVPFRAALRQCGLHIPGTSTIAAITFDHLIAAREGLYPPLLFHELIHVVQYRLLGVGLFARQYVAGFLQQRRYERIPLELCAYELEDRFASSRAPFNAEAAVRSWIEGSGV